MLTLRQKKKMSEIINDNDFLSPNATYVARLALREAVEKAVSLVERDCEAMYKQRNGRAINEHERVYLRKIVLKLCAEYLDNAIKTMDEYNKT